MRQSIDILEIVVKGRHREAVIINVPVGLSRREQKRIETRSMVFDTAIELFDQLGYEGTSVEDICAAAGVGRATFFRHFETKAGLIREHNRRLAETARTTMGPAVGDAPAALMVVADTIHDAWIGAGPGLRALGLEAATLTDPTGERIHPELIDLVADVIRSGRAEGELSAPLPPLLTAYLAVSHLAAAVAWWLVWVDEDLRALLDDALHQLLHGITVQ